MENVDAAANNIPSTSSMAQSIETNDD